mmetsp:Transcript_5989/g.9483  ORF Transcript_5989/g.9483 Transcript_5989/m.9483 type:complete len:829 (-) Transcript_5989:21-2507(-)
MINLSSLPGSCQDAVKDALKESASITQLDCLETRLRSIILDELERTSRDEQKSSKEEMDTTNNHSQLQELFESCLKVCQYLQQEDKGIEGLAKLALVLLEDIVEGTHLPSLETFYDSCQPFDKLCNSALWKTTSGMGHTLQFIRVCNQLLRRLPPKSEWSGRILLELARRLPLTDKSSLKPWGSVSCNGTLELDSDDGDEDYNFYQTFWSLQKDFSNPYQIASFGTFVAKYQQVLTQLETCASNFHHKEDPKKKREPKIEGLSPGSLHYLTSRRLLSAQLESCRDLPLHILTQFSITQAFLSTQSPQLESALEPLAKRNELLMHKLAPRHSQMLTKLLQDREVLWRDWKKNKFQPALQTPQVSGKDITKCERMTLVSLSADKKQEKNADELNFLQPLPDLCKVSQEMLAAVPSIEDHLASYVEALDPDAGIEEEYSPKRDQVMSWQALRLLSQQYLPLFSQITSRGDFENVVRQMYKEKGREIPGEYLAEEISSEEESDKEEENDKMDVDGTQPINADEEDVAAEDQDDNKVEDEDIIRSSEEKKQGPSEVEENTIDQSNANGAVVSSMNDHETANKEGGSFAQQPTPGTDDKESSTQNIKNQSNDENVATEEEGEEVEDEGTNKQISEDNNEDVVKIKSDEPRNKRSEGAQTTDLGNKQEETTNRGKVENDVSDSAPAKHHKEETSRDSAPGKRSNSMETNRQDSRRGSRTKQNIDSHNIEIEERRSSDRPAKRSRLDEPTRGRGSGRGMGGSRGRGPMNSSGRGRGHPIQQDSRGSWDERRGGYDRHEDRRGEPPNNDRRDDRRGGHGPRDGGGRRPHRDSHSRRR